MATPRFDREEAGFIGLDGEAIEAGEDLVDLEWKFGVTASSDEVAQVRALLAEVAFMREG